MDVMEDASSGLLANKVILVTGGTFGIGRASALLFASEGAAVALTGRNVEQGAEVVDAIQTLGGKALFVPADLAQIERIPEIVARTVDRFGRLDGAFNNAGRGGGGPIGRVDEATWDQVVDTNLKAAFFCLQAEVAQMRRQGGGGAILFTGSVPAGLGRPGTAVYSATKGGVVSLARTAAVELGPERIRVNVLNPSITRTAMTEAHITRDGDGRETHPLADNVPLGRLAEPRDVASAALFLLSDAASYVSGQTLEVDGGQSAR